MGIIIGIIIYILSCVAYYKFTQLSYYHPRGVLYKIEPKPIEIVFIFIPIINTINSLILFFLVGWKKDEYKNKTNFFKPKHNKWNK